MFLQVGTTTTGQSVIFETEKSQNLTLHEGGKCTKSIHVAVNGAAVVVAVVVVVVVVVVDSLSPTPQRRT